MDNSEDRPDKLINSYLQEIRELQSAILLAYEVKRHVELAIERKPSPETMRLYELTFEAATTLFEQALLDTGIERAFEIAEMLERLGVAHGLDLLIQTLQESSEAG